MQSKLFVAPPSGRRIAGSRAFLISCLAAVLLLGCPQSPPTEGAAGEPAASAAGSEPAAPEAGTRDKFKVAWSIYVGWMPWDYASSSGILKKWADKYGIEIELVRMDYMASVEAYAAGQIDACTMANIEALTAAAAVDSTVLIVGDYSNGNDAILTRGVGVADLGGQTISLVELSVSHYLLARALEINGIAENDVTLINTSDADIGPTFLADESLQAVVTWNPIVMEVEQGPGIDKVFTSADIPGEILDLMMVQTEVLAANPDLGKALAGAWYEVMAIMSKGGPEADAAIAGMADASDTDAAGYKAQLATTAMFYQSQAAADYTASKEIQEKMSFVRKFSFDKGLLGEGVTSADEVGVSYPDGTVQGAGDSVRMRFDASYMGMAAEGSL